MGVAVEVEDAVCKAVLLAESDSVAANVARLVAVQEPLPLALSDTVPVAEALALSVDVATAVPEPVSVAIAEAEAELLALTDPEDVAVGDVFAVAKALALSVDVAVAIAVPETNDETVEEPVWDSNVVAVALADVESALDEPEVVALADDESEALEALVEVGENAVAV